MVCYILIGIMQVRASSPLRFYAEDRAHEFGRRMVLNGSWSHYRVFPKLMSV